MTSPVQRPTANLPATPPSEAHAAGVPLLSVCIPTYNRAALLGPTLAALVRELPPTGDVEIVVCDNASPDGTTEVLREFADVPGVRVFRNATNIGATGNFLRLVHELARGEFIWVVGDDDLVVAGGCASLVHEIRRRPDVDYFFLNHTYKPVAERVPLGRALSSSAFADLGALLCPDTRDQMVERWEAIVDFTDTPALFTSLISHVARARLWRARRPAADPTGAFDRFDSTFPHVAILAPQLVGRPACYLGAPRVIMFVGAQEWLSAHWSRLLFTHVLGVADLLERLGAPRDLAFRYRDRVYRHGTENFRELMRGPQSRFWKAWLCARLLCRDPRNRTLRQLVLDHVRGHAGRPPTGGTGETRRTV